MAWLWALHMDDVSRDAARREILCKGRLVEGHPLLGSFVKSASHQGVEILRAVGFDFIVIDQEHAPLGREAVMIGCADLAVSRGEAFVDSSNVCRAVQRVSRAAIATGRRVLAPASSVAAAKWLLDLSIEALVVSTDQGLLRGGATEVRRDFSLRRTEITGTAA